MTSDARASAAGTFRGSRRPLKRAINRAACSAVLALAAMALLAPGANASKGVANVLDVEAAGIALNQSSGELYVAVFAGDRIERYDAEGSLTSQFGSTGTANGEFDFQSNARIGVAVDNSGGPSDGSVYVADLGNDRVQKFDAEGNYVTQFGEAGTANGQFESPVGVGVDPTTGDVYVTDIGNNRVQRFTEAGTYVSQFGSTGTSDGQFTFFIGDGADVAVDSTGDVFVLEGFNRVQRFDSGGTFEEVFATSILATPFALTVNPTNDHVYIANRVSSEVTILQLDSAGSEVDAHGTGITGFVSPSGLATSADPAGPIYYASRADTTNDYRVFTLDEIVAPTAILGTIDNVTEHEAEFNGFVNPTGSLTRYRFEYRADDSSTWAPVPDEDVEVGTGTENVAVSQVVTGLEPNVLYHVRLVASKPFGGPSDTSEVETFQTDPLPPVVSGRSAFPITDTTATLRGLIDPNNAETTYFFEYGTDTSYGSRVPVGTDASAGMGGEPIAVAQEVTGLAPETTYHFRLVADSPIGPPTIGPDETVTTISPALAAWPARGIELVNPPDKAGQNPQLPLVWPDGDKVFWLTLSGTPDTSSGAGAPLVSERREDRWITRTLEPPIGEMIGKGDQTYGLLGISARGDSFLFEVGASGLVGSLGERRLVRMNADGSQDVLHKFPSGIFSSGSPIAYSDDLAHVFITSFEALAPEHPAGTTQIYDIGTGTPELVSRADGGSPVCGVGFSNGAFAPRNDSYDWHSADVERVFLTTEGSSCGGSENLYVRDLASDETTLISGPVVSGPDRGGWFLRASRDGSRVVYLTHSNLDPANTDVDPVDTVGQDVYLWTEDSGNSCLTCTGAGSADVDMQPRQGGRAVSVSDDLSRIYFTSNKRLTPGQPDLEVPNHLYVWHDGVIDYIGPTGPFFRHSLTWVDGSAITPSGDVIVFRTNQLGVTPDDIVPSNPDRCLDDGSGNPIPCYQFYRFDLGDHSLECISCPPPGVEPGAAYSVEGVAIGGDDATALSDDGDTFAFTTDAALVPEDANNGYDVYEWHNGVHRLITDGVSEYGPPTDNEAPKIIGLSGNGKDLVFKAADKLTGYEVEEAPQLYSARLGGGFPPPPTPPAPCVEDSCQGPLEAAPPLNPVGSATLSGPGNGRAVKPRGCRRAKKKRGKGCRRAKKKRGKGCRRAKKNGKGGRAKCRERGPKRGRK